MYIRELHEDELWLCSQFGDAFYGEKSLPDQFSFDVFHRNWAEWYTKEIGIIFGLFNDTDQLIGGIGGIVFPDATSGKLKLQEMFWFVDHAARTSTGRWPLRLVFRLREWGKEKGATALRMIHLLLPHETPADKAIANIYVKLLHMRPIEVCFEGPIER